MNTASFLYRDNYKKRYQRWRLRPTINRQICANTCLTIPSIDFKMHNDQSCPLKQSVDQEKYIVEVIDYMTGC